MSSRNPGSETAEERELRLVANVRDKLVAARTDERLQSLLEIYLAPLLLKLASPSYRVRREVMEICKHINVRIMPTQISLPVAALLKQFKETDDMSVRQFDLLYIRIGKDRMPASDRKGILPPLIEKIAQLEAFRASASSVFHLVLSLLPDIELPERDSPQDLQLRAMLGITPESASYLAKWFGKLFLFTPGGEDVKRCPGLSEEEYRFINGENPSRTWNPNSPGCLNLAQTKITAAGFLASGAFLDSERFIPAVILSADSNSNLSAIGEAILKRFQPDVEDSKVVDHLFELYFGTDGPTGALPVRTPVRIKILSFLCNSRTAAAKTDMINKLIDDGFLSPELLADGGLQASKLRDQIFAFVSWFAHAGSQEDIDRVGPRTIDGISAYMSSIGWPNPTRRLSQDEIKLRKFAYQAVGLLLPRYGSRSTKENAELYVRLARWLFVSLSCDNTDDQISLSIEQSIGTLLNTLAGNMDDELQKQLRPILLCQMRYERGQREVISGQTIVRSTKFAAVRFANRCLPYSDVTGRWIALLASGCEAPETAEEGRKGLDPYWYKALNPPAASPFAVGDARQYDSRYAFPRFDDLVRCIFINLNEREKVDSGGGLTMQKLFTKPYFSVYLNTITFLRNILLTEAVYPVKTALDADMDWERNLDTVMSTREDSRRTIKQFLRVAEPGPLNTFLEAAAKGGAIFNQDLDPGRSLDHFVELISLSPDTVLEALLPLTSEMNTVLLSNRALDQRIAARIVGILGSHPKSDFEPAFSVDVTLNVAKIPPLMAGSFDFKKARGAILARAYWLSRMSFRRRVDAALMDRVKEFLNVLITVLQTSDQRHSELRDAVLFAIGQLGLGELLDSNTLPPSFDFLKLNELIHGDAKRNKELVVQTLGRISSGLYRENIHRPVSEVFEILTKPLFGMHDDRNVEIHFAIGEALSVISVGWRSKSLITEYDVDAALLESQVPPGILTLVLEKVIEGCKSPKPSEKKSAAIWLLSLARYCCDDAAVQESLRKCQAVFLRLLSDRDEFVQDIASQGLVLVYSMGNEELRNVLARDFVEFLTLDGSKPTEGAVMVGTELFDPSELPTREGSSLIRTYRDMMSLASELGNPGLMYKFMYLASNKAEMANRTVFATLDLNTVLSDPSLGESLSSNRNLYPSLYRYMFHPNPNVQASMKAIWKALVKDPGGLIDSLFDDIMVELLSSMMNGKEWRTREASCLAITELVQTQPAEKFDKHLQELMTKTLRVMDDVKGSVRAAALTLGQALSKAVIRSLETGSPDSERTRLMLEHIFPFLLGRNGMESSASEAQLFAIMTLVDIIKKCPPKTLGPFVPVLLEKLTLSISSLEPQVANYLHLNAEKYGLTAADIDKRRLDALRSSPIMEVIENNLAQATLQPEWIELVLDRLLSVIRSAVGLLSKVACARFLNVLCSNDTKFSPFADRFMRVVRTLVFDRDEFVGAAYARVLGRLARLTTRSELLDTISWARNCYFSGEKEDSRVVAAEVAKSLMDSSGERIMREVPAAFLPFVFIALHDEDKDVNEAFRKIWGDCVGGNRTVLLYLDEILKLIAENLDSQQWAVKHACAVTIGGSVINALGNIIEPQHAQRVWPCLRKALEGRVWNGKPAVLEGFTKFVKTAKAFWQMCPDVASEMTDIILREARRVTPFYIPAALRCLGLYAEAREDLNLMRETLDIGRSVLVRLRDGKIDLGGDLSKMKDNLEEQIYSSIVVCTLGCVNPSAVSPDKLNPYLMETACLAAHAVNLGGSATYDDLYNQLTSLFDRVGKVDTFMPDCETAVDYAMWVVADLLLFRDRPVALAQTRMNRAQAALGYAKLLKEKCWAQTISHSQMRASWNVRERDPAISVVFNEMKQTLNHVNRLYLIDLPVTLPQIDAIGRFLDRNGTETSFGYT
ncbi:hypothetical protein VTO42DRAFT_341 [Malbranchea cinnamomea]